MTSRLVSWRAGAEEIISLVTLLEVVSFAYRRRDSPSIMM